MPKEWAIQRLGLVTDNAMYLYLRDVEQGQSTAPENEHADDLEQENEDLDFTNMQTPSGQDIKPKQPSDTGPMTVCNRKSAKNPAHPVLGLASAFLEGNSNDRLPATDNIVA